RTALTKRDGCQVSRHHPRGGPPHRAGTPRKTSLAPAVPIPAVVAKDERMQRGLVLEREHRFAEARQVYNAGLVERPAEIAYLEGAPRTATMAGDHRAAAEHLRRAVAADPASRALRERLAVALLQTGDLAAAEEEARVAKDRKKDASILNLLGVILKR